MSGERSTVCRRGPRRFVGGGRKINLFPILLAAIAVLAAAACASSPPARFFRLVPTAEAGRYAGERAVVIGPFRLADYLDRPQIVTRARGSGVAINDFDRWAEPLDANFQSAVAANVARLLGSDSVLEFPAHAILEAERRVTGRVSQLDVDARGRAVLEVQWGVLDGEGAIAIPARRSRYEAATAGPGAGAAVAAMSETVRQFSEDVAAAVR